MENQKDRGGNNMSERFILNETAYFGKGAREELVEEIQKRKFEKVFLVSDKALV